MKNAILACTVLVCLAMAGSLSGQQPVSARDLPEAAAPPAMRTSPQTVVPRLIKFNGVLRDLAGKPITGPVDVTFSLYSDEAGGAPLWFETQTLPADSLGGYSVLLGAMSPAGVPMELFTEGQARWLGVMVRGLPEQPRVLLVSVPYAIKAGDAETLGGKPASAYQLAPESAASSGSTTRQGTTATRGGKKATSKTGSPTPQAVTTTASYFPIFANNTGALTNSVMYQYGARIGVGTTTPSFPFDLNGNVFGIGPTAALPGAGGTMRFRDDTATVRWSFGVPGTAGATDFFLYNNVNGHAPFYIQAGAASYSLYMSANGNVGMGTVSPGAKLDVVGAVRSSSTVTGTQLISTVATGTAPLSVTSTTQVPNLNASKLGGIAPSGFATIASNAFTGNQSIAGTLGIRTTTPTSSLHVLGTSTTSTANVFAVDAIAGECAGNACAGIDAFSAGTNGIGIFAEATGSGGIAGQFNGQVLVSGDIAINQPGAGLLLTSADNSHCAHVVLDNSGNLILNPVACPVRRSLRGR
ncbi:MAG TPA: hypothetical protein VFM21_00955 [Terriglobia bacterium]|nr:hypothetical protein [Terriglobia bacterium]